MPTIRRLLVIIGIIVAMGRLAAAPAGASASVTLDGSFSTAIVKPQWTGSCPSGVADECGTMQLVGLGTADWAYAFGPTFAADGRCFDVDGTFLLTLQADGSTVSGPLVGLYCPRLSDAGHDHAGAISYGNPFVEDDSIAFSGGTGQFAGLAGHRQLPHLRRRGRGTLERKVALRGVLAGQLGCGCGRDAASAGA